MPFEFAFLDWLYQFRNPVMNTISIFFDYAGAHGEIWIAFTLLLLLFRCTRKAGFAMAVALVVSFLMTPVVKTFAYKVKKYIGAYAAALGGVDAIVFTAGVGENDRAIREAIAGGLGYLGVEFDSEANLNCPRGEEAEISAKGSRVKVFVIPTDEEMVIARDTAALAAK